MAPPTPDVGGLQAIVRQRLLSDVFDASCDKCPGWMVLVVDNPALRVISSALGMYELMEKRVTIVESLTKVRAPFKEMGVIYVVEPTAENVERILSDFPGGKKSLYGDSVFLYFLSAFPDDLLDKLKKNHSLMKRLKTFTELNIDFLAKESRAFHLDLKSSLSMLFTNNPSSIVSKIVSKLVTVCATLHEYPHIRYPNDSPLCEEIAQAFHGKMNMFVGSSPKWWYHGMQGHETRDRSTLLLLDRGEDALSPFMHEFTYQAMVNDLLPINDERLSCSTGNGKKDVLLNENDQLWVELKGKHIADVVQILSDRIRDFVQSNAGAVVSKDSGTSLSLSEMAEALKKLPEYREVMSKLAEHMHIAHECLGILNKDGLLEVSELEQTMATGQDENKKEVKLSNVLKTLEEVLPTMPADEATRVLAIFIVSQGGISAETRERLFSMSKLSSGQKRAILNLERLGLTIESTSSTSNSKRGMFNKFRKSARLIVNSKQIKGDSTYTNSRYACSLKSIMEDLVHEKLSVTEYPSVLPLPIAGGGIATTARRKKGTAKNVKTFTGPRKIIFMAGGLCFSELRSADEVMSTCDKEIIIGSTDFVNPTEYMESLRALG
mmetsp:Transcript_21049/g.32116  ORF Transcript_21049/g.32116 Transcript_21049/m.32116 type:complete len:607 (+) Transcript_21049:127-1947(+)|eukprot:CAMPEP_0196803732 /NCGR_PEP_ID=MMETSP1362-20130617/3217_1 /TAXON_ID=163516 /ORGANISM="Leptocylindrus danicus, Strain CCMP1856" /LENGTH=606 /DNA_ID=CAMNT_0042175537 /DNA_START=63 /DNA_END=1883 /DNA_ORIENTATION=-